jgi:hypothetical protein
MTVGEVADGIGGIVVGAVAVVAGDWAALEGTHPATATATARHPSKRIREIMTGCDQWTWAGVSTVTVAWMPSGPSGSSGKVMGFPKLTGWVGLDRFNGLSQKCVIPRDWVTSQLSWGPSVYLNTSAWADRPFPHPPPGVGRSLPRGDDRRPVRRIARR